MSTTISSGGGVGLYSNSVSGTRLKAGLGADATQVATPTPAAGNDTVSISAEGLRRSTSSPAALQSVSNVFSAHLHDNPDQAEVGRFVKSAALALDSPLVSLGATPDSPVRYTGTGQIVTDKSRSDFNAQAKEVQAARKSIYEEESAKGTAPADIWDKLVNYMQSLPGDFKLQAGG